MSTGSPTRSGASATLILHATRAFSENNPANLLPSPSYPSPHSHSQRPRGFIEVGNYLTEGRDTLTQWVGYKAQCMHRDCTGVPKSVLRVLPRQCRVRPSPPRATQIPGPCLAVPLVPLPRRWHLQGCYLYRDLGAAAALARPAASNTLPST